MFKIAVAVLIVKTAGDTIRAKLPEIRVNEVIYTKTNLPYGPVFTLLKSDIAFIIYSNSEIEKFSNAQTAQSTSKNSATASSDSNTATKGDEKLGKNKIEFITDSYFINGEKAKRKDVNRYLSKSQNPAIVVGLKVAKSMSLAQKSQRSLPIPPPLSAVLQVW